MISQSWLLEIYFGNVGASNVGSHHILTRWVQPILLYTSTILWFLLAENVFASLSFLAQDS